MPSAANPTDLKDFADMSAALTGFTPEFVRPPLDPINLTQAYFDEATARTAHQAVTVQTLLTAYRAVKDRPPQVIADTLLETASAAPSDSARLAQSIVLLWYFGAWYAPLPSGAPAPVAAGACPPPLPPGPVKVVSAMAYTHGFAWNVMQSHPMGYSEFAFGYWSTSPGPLSQFGVNDTKAGGQ
jgi:hypothetical protein